MFITFESFDFFIRPISEIVNTRSVIGDIRKHGDPGLINLFSFGEFIFRRVCLVEVMEVLLVGGVG